ncbi:MAG: MATE family efflux transporter [Synergistaceae bacterium]|nr:MATE family efflux transporter [Synergistaceae bacterium]
MEEKSNAYLETAPIGTLMRKYSIPCIISLLVAALYNIVDQLFIANASYLGSYGNAANTVVFPMTVLALGIAVMIGDGACAFVSISLGANKTYDAHRSIGNAILLCLISSVILTGVYLIFMDPILTAFGGRVNEETFNQAQEYFFWITLGIPFYMFGQAMNPIIRSDGSPKFAMFSTVSGAVANIILDPIFIFPLHMGMKGAAIATVLGQILTAALSLWYLMNMKAVKLGKNSFGFWPTLMKKFLVLGITSFLSQVSLVISMAAVQNMCTKYGALDPIFGQAEYSQIPLAVLGIVMKFFQIAISIAVGLAAGCISIVGFNIGAGRKDRAKKLFSYLLTSEALVGLVALLIVEFFPRELINIFGAGNESAYYTEFAIKSFRVYLCMMILSVVNKGTFIYLQALGKAALSTIISLLREIVLGVALPILLPIFMGLDGILWSFPVADILTFFVATVIIRKVYKELSENEISKSEKSQEISEIKRGEILTNYIITIGRSYASGGRTIGKKVAEMLGVPYYDSELLEKAAKTTGLNRKFLESLDEKPISNSMLYRSVGFGTASYNNIAREALRAQREVIEKVAAEGACVIVGRLADQVLAGKYKLLRIFITSGSESRIKRIMERDSLSREDAIKKMNKADKERAAYYNQLSKTKWGNADGYDLCLDTDFFGIDGTANLIISAAKNNS